MGSSHTDMLLCGDTTTFTVQTLACDTSCSHYEVHRLVHKFKRGEQQCRHMPSASRNEPTSTSQQKAMQ